MRDRKKNTAHYKLNLPRRNGKYMKRGMKRVAIVLMILCLTAMAAFAQGKQTSQGTKYGEAGFIGEPININVNKADIRDILTYITEQYGVNFVIDGSVKDVPVTVKLNDVPWNVALDSILRANGLGVDINGPILRVADNKTLAEEASIRAKSDELRLDNKPLYTEYIRLNYSRVSNSLSVAAGDSGGYKGGTGTSVTSIVSFTNGGNANTSGTSNGSDGGTGDSGILPIIRRRLSRRGSIEGDQRSNTLIITDVRENIDAIRQLVTLLDQPEPQVEVEARIVLASRAFFREFGFQFNILIKDSFGGRGTVFGGTQPVTPSTGGTSGTPPGTPIFPIPSGLTSAQATTAPNTVIGLTTNAFGTAQISALLTAAENKNQAKTIASPRVTALNNRSAEIESGTQIPIVTPQAGGTGGTTIFTTTYISVPLRLSVTPQITDSGVVLMKIVAENNTVAPGSTIISSQKMKTEVLVPDGGTTVVGGAVIDDEREDRHRTPGLSGIPLLGNLFKDKVTQRTTSEILFFITPRIYRPDYQGNPTQGTVSPNGNRSTTILQPVPLGNPPTNTPSTPTETPRQQTNLVLPSEVQIGQPIPTAGKPPQQ